MPIIGEVPDPKEDHTGVAGPPIGPLVYLVVRHDGKIVSLETSRHDAAWTIERCHDCNDFSVEMVPVGMVPIDDLGIPERFR